MTIQEYEHDTQINYEFSSGFVGIHEYKTEFIEVIQERVSLTLRSIGFSWNHASLKQISNSENIEPNF